MKNVTGSHMRLLSEKCRVLTNNNRSSSAQLFVVLSPLQPDSSYTVYGFSHGCITDQENPASVLEFFPSSTFSMKPFTCVRSDSFGSFALLRGVAQPLDVDGTRYRLFRIAQSHGRVGKGLG